MGMRQGMCEILSESVRPNGMRFLWMLTLTSPSYPMRSCSAWQMTLTRETDKGQMLHDSWA